MYIFIYIYSINMYVYIYILHSAWYTEYTVYIGILMDPVTDSGFNPQTDS